MSADRTEVALVATAVAGGAIAVAAVSDPGVATAGGVVGLLAVLGLLAREALRSIRTAPEPAPPASSDDPLVAFRAAIAGSIVQRDRVLATLARIDHARGSAVATLSPSEAARLERVPPEEFRSWLRREIERREAEA